MHQKLCFWTFWTLCTFIAKTHCFVTSNVYITVNSHLFLLLAAGMYFCTIWTGGVLVPVSVMCTLGQQQLIRRRLTGFPPTRDSAMYFCEHASVFLWICVCISFCNSISINMRLYFFLKLYFYKYAYFFFLKLHLCEYVSVFLFKTVFL